jgi:hypothetical protein
MGKARNTYVCIYTYRGNWPLNLYVYIYIYTHTHTNTHTHTEGSIYTYIHTYTYTYINIYICIQRVVALRRHDSKGHCWQPATFSACRLPAAQSPASDATAYVSIRQHTSAYVSIRQHTSAYVSIRQHTSHTVPRCRQR